MDLSDLERQGRTADVAGQHLLGLPVHGNLFSGRPVLLVRDHGGRVCHHRVLLNPQQIVRLLHGPDLAQGGLDDSNLWCLLLHKSEREHPTRALPFTFMCGLRQHDHLIGDIQEGEVGIGTQQRHWYQTMAHDWSAGSVNTTWQRCPGVVSGHCGCSVETELRAFACMNMKRKPCSRA